MSNQVEYAVPARKLGKGDIDGARGALKDALAKGDFPKIDAARFELDRLDRTVSKM